MNDLLCLPRKVYKGFIFPLRIAQIFKFCAFKWEITLGWARQEDEYG